MVAKGELLKSEEVTRIQFRRALKIARDLLMLGETMSGRDAQTARDLLSTDARYLGIALANIVHLINPSVIILGGQVAQAGELLIAPLQANLRDLCMPAAGSSARIVQGKLGSEANIVGAVTLALQDI